MTPMLQRNVATGTLLRLVGVVALFAGLVLWLSAGQSSKKAGLSDDVKTTTYIGVLSVIRTTDRWPQTLLIVTDPHTESTNSFNCSAIIDTCRTLGLQPFEGYVKAKGETPIEVVSHTKGTLISESMQSAHLHARNDASHDLLSLGRWLMGLGVLTIVLLSGLRMPTKLLK